MKLYIWEGNGISSAYHDDGTLVVLADSPEQAREVVRHEPKYQWDGSDEALDRDPDRVVDLDQPVVVAFNGGGYD